MDQHLQLQQLLQAGPWRQREEESSDDEITERDVEEELDDVVDSHNHNDATMARLHLTTATGISLAEDAREEDDREDNT